MQKLELINFEWGAVSIVRGLNKGRRGENPSVLKARSETVRGVHRSAGGEKGARFLPSVTSINL